MKDAHWIVKHIQLFFCRKLHIHLATREKCVALKINASSQKLQQSTCFRFNATYCSACLTKLNEEQIPQSLFWLHKNTDDTVFRRSI